MLSPQHQALPLRSSQEWLYPAEIVVGWTVTAAGTLTLTAVAALPTWPELLSPQQYRLVVARAQVESWAPAIWVRVTPDRSPEVDTATGTSVLVVELLPSWPSLSWPQQYAAPADDSAQTKPCPASIWLTVTPDSTPEVVTATGTLLSLWEPLPSVPFELAPQQYTAPPPSAQVKLVPSAIPVTVTPDIGVPLVITATGVLWVLAVVLLPSWPLPL